MATLRIHVDELGRQQDVGRRLRCATDADKRRLVDNPGHRPDRNAGNSGNVAHGRPPGGGHFGYVVHRALFS
jgi:hypothetical protein